MLISLVLLGGIALGATAKSVFDELFSENVAALSEYSPREPGAADLIVKQLGSAEDLGLGSTMSGNGDDGHSARNFWLCLQVMRIAEDQAPEGHVLTRFVYDVDTMNWYAEYRPQ